jgi:hypothetical protein
MHLRIPWKPMSPYCFASATTSSTLPLRRLFNCLERSFKMLGSRLRFCFRRSGPPDQKSARTGASHLGRILRIYGLPPEWSREIRAQSSKHLSPRRQGQWVRKKSIPFVVLREIFDRIRKCLVKGQALIPPLLSTGDSGDIAVQQTLSTKVRPGTCPKSRQERGELSAATDSRYGS